jgi:NADH-quinone oxidoreductase subunit M
MAGSVLMLVAILFLFFLNQEQTGRYSFDILESYNLSLGFSSQVWLFLAFALAFAIKIPMFPFHTWLPDAHVEAPTAGSVILAGVLLKMGTYGFIRFCLPLFPLASLELTPLIRTLAVIGIVYGAMVSLVQDDMKKLVAYSSVSHLGFCMLGLFALNQPGVQGSLLQMVNHGLSTGALFLIVGIIYERRHTRRIAEFGGIYRIVPKMALVFLIVAFSSIGVPGLNGFVGELLIMIGAYQSNIYFAVLGTVGLILGPVYLLWMYKRVMLGNIGNEQNRGMTDLNGRELAYLLPFVGLIILIGIYPKPFIKTTEASVIHLLDRIESHRNQNFIQHAEMANTLRFKSMPETTELK